MSAPNEEHSQDGDWGWEPLGSEDEEPQNAQGVVINAKQDSDATEADGKPNSMTKRNSSDKNLRRGSFTGQKMQGIVSSPSFLELEKAIGATLNLASNDSGDLEGRTTQSPPSTSTFPPSKLSSTNLTQQKVNQQRLRQQQQQTQRYSGMQNQYNRSPAAGTYGYNNNVPSGYALIPPVLAPPARVELAPFINESESRAVILFHSVHVSPADIRNACSKYGVLYYIRPEFHNKGVTFLSYFDLRAASSARGCLVEDLGRGAEASAHFSVMLHAANGNSEEFRLVVRNLPADSCAEADVQAIFARYGQLRSIQKTFEDGNRTTPRSPNSEKSGGSDGETTRSLKEGENGSADAPAEDSANCRIAYSVEYYNIQDARLAASELSATSAQLWNADVTVKFAPLDERKQQLCRQLLATLSRWRTEMAAAASTSSSAAAAAMSYNFNMQQQQQMQLRQQQQMGMGMSLAGYGQGMGMGMGLGGLNMGMALNQQGQPMASAEGGLTSFFDPSNPFYQQQVYMQQQVQQMQQQQQRFLASGGSGAVDHSGMPMSVQAMAGMMYAPSSPGGLLDGSGLSSSRGISPMQSLMPANLSNPNLFNLGLLAAQAEAQMQQQQQQMLLLRQQQQQNQLQQSDAPVGGATGTSPVNSDGYGDGGASSSTAVQRPSAHLHQDHQQYGAGSRYSQQGANATQRPQHQQSQSQLMHHQQNGGRGGSAPPHHHHNHSGAYPVHSYGGSGGANMTTGGMPLHHHQQHQLNMQHSGYNMNVNQQGLPMNTHSQQQQRRAGKNQQQAGTGVGQYGYPAFPSAGGAASNASGSRGDSQQQDSDFVLDLKRIGDDEETRTTVMVRNIPNKYNQQMLLEEVNVSHEGTYDFFYLPIDFKNRCNVGYCFINFLDPKHIPPFVNSFNGQRWKSFNSEKVCAVTFARIQGKQAMISRFQNSSLLEKDDEYQPLLFYSTGPDRGRPEPFPVSSNLRRAQQLQGQPQQQPGPPGAPSHHHPGASHSPPPSHVSPLSVSSSRSATPPPPLNAATPRSVPPQHQYQQQQQQQQQQQLGEPATEAAALAGKADIAPQDAGAA